MNKIYLCLLLVLGFTYQITAQNSTCGSCTQDGISLATNGTFNNVNVGFTNNLTFSATGSSSPGTYTVRTQTNTFWLGGCTINDHTSSGGTGLLMVDGKSSGTTVAWEQTISNLKQNQDYILSFYAKLGTCVLSGSAPTIKIMANSVQVGDTFNIRVGPWRKVSYKWNSGNATSTVLQIIDTVQSTNGNDFIIDDLSFFPCDPTVTVDAGSDLNTCTGSTVQLSSSGTGFGTCSWSGPTGLNNTNTCSPVFTASTTGDFNYVVNYAYAGCTASDTINIHVDVPPPVPTIYQYGDTLFSSYASAYQWYSSFGIISGETGPYYLPIQNGFYTVHAIDAKGCETSSSSFFYTKCSQLISISAGSDQTICQGKQATLNAISNGPGSCTWSGPSGLNNLHTCSPVFTSVYAGNFSFTVTDTLNGCIASDEVTIFVNTLPAKPTLSRNGDTLISTSASSYQWYKSGALLSGQTGIKYKPSTGGYYSVVITNANGCSISSDSILFVPCSQYYNIQTIADATVCAGIPVTLTSTSSIQGTCSWSGPAGLDSYTNCSPVFNLNTAGDYTFIITGQLSGCTDADTVNIHVDATPPQPVITQQGDSLISSQASAYQWNLNSNIINGATSSFLIPTQAGPYTVTAIDPKGCQNTSDPYQFDPCLNKVQIQASADTAVCEGIPVMLWASGNGSGNCLWQGPSGLDSYATCNPVFSSAAAGYYTYIVTDTLSGCQASDTVVVMVAGMPINPAVTINGDSALAPPASSYQWYTLGNSIQGATQAWYLPSMQGYYYVAIVTTGGCEATTDSVFFTPCSQLVNIETIADTSICAGSPVTFYTNGTGGGSCMWTGPSGLDNFNTCEPVFLSNSGGDFVYHVYNFLNGCESYDSVSIHVNDLPQVPVVTQIQDSLISTPANAYQWYASGLPLPFENNYFIIPNQHNWYSVEIEDQNGCRAFSDSISPGFTAIHDQVGNQQIEIQYDMVLDQISILNNSLKNERVTIGLYDITGKSLNQTVVMINAGTILRSNKATDTPGIYFIQVSTSKDLIVKRILKVKP